jgi:bifunctional DNA-binding transcriptional regulator/antitoxin component of YhaV-PrlF toxin-antitoxin module
MPSVKVNAKYQITLPSAVLNIQKGDCWASIKFSDFKKAVWIPF